MSYKHVAIDIDTYTKLKEDAKNNGRTIVGEIRYLLQSKIGDAPSYLDEEEGENTHNMFKKPKSEKQVRLQQMQNRLQYFDEGSEEYQEALEEIQQLMAE